MDGTARVWDLEEELSCIVLKGHNDSLMHGSFSDTGNRVFTGSKDGTVRSWDVSQGIQVKDQESYALSPCGSMVAMASRKDKTIRVWDRATGAELQKWNCPEGAKYCAFVPGANRLITISTTHIHSLWDIGTGERIASNQYIKTKDVNSIDLCSDGSKMVLATNNNTAYLMSTETLEIISPLTHDDWINSARFSPDGNMIVTVTKGGSCRIWNTTSKKDFAVLKNSGRIRAAEFKPDNSQVLTVSSDGTARLWDVRTGRDIGILHDTGWIDSARFSPDGTKFVTVSSFAGDWLCTVWNADTLASITQLKKHENNINSAAFSPDGMKLVTASDDGTGRVWDASSGEELFRFDHDAPALSAAFTPDGQWVIVFNRDGTVNTWSLDPLSVAHQRISGTLLQDENTSFLGSRSGTDPERFHQCALDLLMSPENSIREYHYAHEWALFAYESDPKNTHYMKTLGLALYRLGKHQDALDMLNRCKERQEEADRTVRPSIHALISMVELALDQREKAQAAYDQIRASFESANRDNPDEDLLLALEAESLLARNQLVMKNAKPKKIYQGIEGAPNLVFLAGNKDKCLDEIVHYDPSGKGDYTTVYHANGREIRSPCVSADGRRLCFLMQENASNYSLNILDINTAENLSPRSICKALSSTADELSWHPDGTKIYFSMEYGISEYKGTGIYWVDVKGREDQKPKMLIHCPGQVMTGPRISPNGKRICFVHYPGLSRGFEYEIFIENLDEDGIRVWAPEQLTSNTRNDSCCRFSMDGRHLYWVSQDQDFSFRIQRMFLDGSGKKTLLGELVTDKLHINYYSISATGLIAYYLMEDDNGRIELYDSEQHQTYVLPHYDRLCTQFPCMIK